MAEVTLPQLGETVTEGTITQWFKYVGDTVAADEPLFEVSTDKVDTEVPSPVAGVLTEIRVPEGETVDVGTVIAVVGDAGAAAAPAAAAAPNRPLPNRPRRPAPAAEPARCEPAAAGPAAEPAPAAEPRHLPERRARTRAGARSAEPRRASESRAAAAEQPAPAAAAAPDAGRPPRRRRPTGSRPGCCCRRWSAGWSNEHGLDPAVDRRAAAPADGSPATTCCDHIDVDRQRPGAGRRSTGRCCSCPRHRRRPRRPSAAPAAPQPPAAPAPRSGSGRAAPAAPVATAGAAATRSSS